ncbi:MAG TPA: Hint domain-containing protein [Methylorubrum populi]|uniref:Hint domain-containing protein n=1 Tax=Methylorubrum populi TaxID=223967 RepID=A0A921E5H7_9HYPH|nr:Hint domain-containing protein [Methylorubrum populi]
MAETFATDFTAGQAATGVVGANGFTGTSLTSLLTTATITGNVTNPGDQVAATVTVLGTAPITTTATYEGFSVPTGGGEPTYYFSLTPVGLNTPAGIAVTKGGTLPLLGVLQPVTRGEAPDSPNIVCFVTGTQIRTERGEVAVEDLRVGDFAVTASGALRPITWIGHREITAEAGSLPFHQQPVHVRAGAFGHGLPARDLFLSPGHPVLVGADADNEGGVLVPVMCLINGTSITREPRATVTYWHVELDAHDILLAEGLPAESYIDGGDRAFFAEASDHALHNPDFVPAGWNGRCRPVAVEGSVVETERLRLDAVFAGSLSAPCAWEAADTLDWLAA